MGLLTPSDIQHSAATQIWGCYRLVSRAKVIENQQSCLLHHPLSPTLPSTPTLSPAEPSGEPMMRRPEESTNMPISSDEDERELCCMAMILIMFQNCIPCVDTFGGWSMCT
ncbi:hypothetical protein Tco_1109196 [Tanacetum coccineum]